MGNLDNNQKATIATEVPVSVKEAYRKWWQKQGFASEADALRWHIRKVINFDPESQEQKTENHNNFDSQRDVQDSSKRTKMAQERIV